MHTDIQRQLARAPLTSYQLSAIGICVLLNMLDGFDILATSFAATSIKTEWGLLDQELGALLSAGLVGMAAGALVLGLCADFWGRRPVVLLSLTLASLGMLGSAIAHDYVRLLICRLLTGVGIGGMLASVVVVLSEYAPDRWRSTMIVIFNTGYAVGATIGGLVSAYAVPRFGWQSLFGIGACLSAMALPIVWLRLPESLDFLLSRRPAHALQRVNTLLGKMRWPALTELPLPHKGTPAVNHGISARQRFRLLATPSTVLIWAAFLIVLGGYYFVLSWTPRLLTTKGLTAVEGMTAGALLNGGGIIGCALFAIAAIRYDARRLTVGALIGSGAVLATFGASMDDTTVAVWLALMLGVITNAAVSGLYALTPPLYPPSVRATGMGFAIGAGRFGAIGAPVITGALLDRGWDPAMLYFGYGASFTLAAAMLLIRCNQGPAAFLDAETADLRSIERPE